MTKQDQLKANMIQLQLEIGRDQENLRQCKNRLKDRMAILYALTAELDGMQIESAQGDIDKELRKLDLNNDNIQPIFLDGEYNEAT